MTKYTFTLSNEERAKGVVKEYVESEIKKWFLGMGEGIVQNTFCFPVENLQYDIILNIQKRVIKNGKS